MRNLVIDSGNTTSKLGVFINGELIHYNVLEEISPGFIDELIKYYQVQHSTVSSVSKKLDDVVELLKSNTKYTQFSTSSNTGIKNHYKTADTLGLDRWAKVIAANRYHKDRNCFIIDAGTCITYDLLTSNSEYFGGSISLGIPMRFEALHHFTGRLPQVAWDKEMLEIPDGTDTNSAISNGVLQGTINEVLGFISLQNKRNKDLTVLLTGGDAAFLLEQLKNSIFAPQIIHDPYLVLKGLNEVIAFEYVQKD